MPGPQSERFDQPSEYGCSDVALQPSKAHFVIAAISFWVQVWVQLTLFALQVIDLTRRLAVTAPIYLFGPQLLAPIKSSCPCGRSPFQRARTISLRPLSPVRTARSQTPLNTPATSWLELSGSPCLALTLHGAVPILPHALGILSYCFGTPIGRVRNCLLTPISRFGAHKIVLPLRPFTIPTRSHHFPATFLTCAYCQIANFPPRPNCAPSWTRPCPMAAANCYCHLHRNARERIARATLVRCRSRRRYYPCAATGR